MPLIAFRPDEKIVLATLALTVTATIALVGADTQHDRTVTITDLKQNVATLNSDIGTAETETKDADTKTEELTGLITEQDGAFDSTEGFIQ